ncbi:ankyrin repeat-containing domain protein [Geopyxis carbonaria]|nr:ankyrin repeat-containing domain protein [Geopyxis carbonaria]
MDGLSVAASLAGLLQLSAKVISLLSTMKDAPSLAENVYREVVALKAIFHQLQEFISQSPTTSEGQGGMIHVDHIVVTLTGCVCAFGELERELEDLELNPSKREPGIKGWTLNAWDRAKWAQKDSNIRRIIGDLERIKSSLNMMVTIYTCRSTQEAQSQILKITKLIEILLKSNPPLARRMSNFSFNFDFNFDNLPHVDDDSDTLTIRSANSFKSELNPARPETLESGYAEEHHSVRRSSVFTITNFEDCLNKTRVYVNAFRNSSTNTFVSLNTSSSHWSQLSGVTVSQVSNVSFIHLPVAISELVDPTIWVAPRTYVTRSSSVRRTFPPLYRRIRHKLFGENGEYELNRAILDGDILKIAVLYHSGVNIESRDKHNHSALYRAISQEPMNIHVVRLLIVGGASPNTVSGSHGTAFQHAVAKGYLEVVYELLGAGADVNTCAGRYGTPLQAAAGMLPSIHTTTAEETIALLIKEGAEVNTQGGIYGNALQAAVSQVPTRESVVRRLIEHGADVHTQGGMYGNALQAAVSQVPTCESVVCLLIEAGVDVNVTGGPYECALQAAVSNCTLNERIIRLLIENGAEVTPGVIRTAVAYEHWTEFRQIVNKLRAEFVTVAGVALVDEKEKKEEKEEEEMEGEEEEDGEEGEEGEEAKEREEGEEMETDDKDADITETLGIPDSPTLGERNIRIKRAYSRLRPTWPLNHLKPPPIFVHD